MTAKLQDVNLDARDIIVDEKEQFKQDVLYGLSKNPKSLNSKYFYDEIGSELFNEITKNPDYYLTETEITILDKNKEDLSSLLGKDAFNLVELGPGEGIKTHLLIDQFIKDKHQFSYYPIDISAKYLSHLIEKFNNELPNLETTAINADYLNGLKWLNNHSTRRNVILFLGSSIGNFSIKESEFFLHHLRSQMKPNDLILIGFDRLKKIDILMQAYNDQKGLTRKFNLNLLTRLNRELGANFNIGSFQHYGTYNVHTGAMESYLVSTKAQIVYIDALKKTFGFKKSEPIYVESSQKYSLKQIERLAHLNEFAIVKNFTDKKHYFYNSLWQVP